MPTPLVELMDVSVVIDGATLLDSISWQIQPHSTWAVLGPNGAGKTTLIKLVGGLMWPNAGGCILREGARLPNLHAMRRGIGWVSCELGRRVPAREKVQGLIESGRYAELGLRPPIRTETSEACAADARQLIDHLRIDHLTDRQFVTLSQGEQQIALLARAMMAEPSLIILDEPCAGLDPQAREAFLETLARAVNQTSPTPAVVLVSHHLEEVIQEINNILWLKAGRVESEGLASDCLNAGMVERVYGRRPRSIRFSHGRHWPIW